MLMEHYARSRVVCTQPRRLAAVAIAERVASERGVVCGEDVGYAIGQYKALSASTRLSFSTAGWLLHLVRQEGEAAFEGVAALLIDEVHERSVESDVLLASVRQLWAKSDKLRRSTRLVLMSATLDLERFKRYMLLPGEEHVNLVIVDSEQRPAEMGPSTFRDVEEVYSDEVARRIGGDEEIGPLFRSVSERTTALLREAGHADGDDATDACAAITAHAHDSLLHQAVSAIVRYVASRASSTTLVFLPTYRALQTQHALLVGGDFDVAILHSSTDVEDCLKAIAGRSEGRAAVILSTNVAESSVTIPDVVDVVDCCLTNQVVWNHDTRTSRSRVVFASIVQLDQRRGRTGRVRSGVCWRLVPRSAVRSSGNVLLDSYETPAIRLQALDKTVLALASSQNSAMADPARLLASALDPPEERHVLLSLRYLVDIRALAETQSRRRQAYTPTAYGGILAEMPISLEAARIVFALASRGLPRLAALVGAVLSSSPKPIRRPFTNDEVSYADIVTRFSNATARHKRQRDLAAVHDLVANLAAFEFFQAHFLDLRRAKSNDEHQDKNEEELTFCTAHDLVPSALRDVDTQTAVLMGVIHRRRPFFIAEGGSDVPAYRRLRTDIDRHVCAFVENEPLPRKCIAPSSAHSTSLHQIIFTPTELAAIEDAYFQVVLNVASANTLQVPPPDDDGEDEQRPPCRFFRRGACTRGSSCRFSHDLSRMTRLCAFFGSDEGCRFGENCAYVHSEQSARPADRAFDYTACVNRLNSNEPAPATCRSSYAAYAKIVLLSATGDDDFAVAESLVSRCGSEQIVIAASRRSLDISSHRQMMLRNYASTTLVGDIDLYSDSTSLTSLLRDISPNLVVVHGAADVCKDFFGACRHVSTEPPGTLHVVLTPEDFAKRRVFQLALDNFYYLHDSFDFDLDDPTAVTRKTLVTYVFQPGSLPKYLPRQHNLPDTPTCSICLETLYASRTVRLNNCSHMVCSSCAQRLRAQSNGPHSFLCPLCRTPHFEFTASTSSNSLANRHLPGRAVIG